MFVVTFNVRRIIQEIFDIRFAPIFVVVTNEFDVVVIDGIISGVKYIIIRVLPINVLAGIYGAISIVTDLGFHRFCKVGLKLFHIICFIRYVGDS